MNTKVKHVFKFKKRIFMIIIILVILVIVGLVGFSIYGNYRLSLIPNMSFQDVVQYSTAKNPDAVITVGIIKDGKIAYEVYGENGKVLPQNLHTYEIGSITKTFTASLISKAVQDGKIKLSDTIDMYIELPKQDNYPTIEDILTHTSGYKSYYFETPMISNFFSGKNSFFGITKDMTSKKIASAKIQNQKYSFRYSNFGYAVLGLILENVYQEDYTSLMNKYAKQDLGLRNTKISDGTGDLSNYWDWNEQDAYISAGAILSNVEDMLLYADMQLKGNPSYLQECQNPIKTVNASSASYKTMDINIDKIGMAWITDSNNNIIWHNGGTGDYNSYIGFNKDTQTAVVVLSNLPPFSKIPATVVGIKKLADIQP